MFLYIVKPSEYRIKHLISMFDKNINIERAFENKIGFWWRGERERERETDRETETERERERDRQIVRDIYYIYISPPPMTLHSRGRDEFLHAHPFFYKFHDSLKKTLSPLENFLDTPLPSGQIKLIIGSLHF